MEHITQQIKQKLINGERLTVVSVFRDLSTYELRHFIPILKKELPIKSEWAKNDGIGKRYKIYWLDNQAA